jgi:CheY-like chemotaxis protein
VIDRDREADGRLRFTVSDTGIGIPADKLEAVFSNFTQVDSSTTRKYGGTGLGLAIAQRLVGLMEGKIWVESVIGSGSKFIFTANFGLAPATVATGHAKSTGIVKLAEPAGASSQVAVELPAVRILVAEDSPDNRLVISAFLRRTPCQIDFAENGEIAVDKFVHDHYDLVLMDMQMPVMDGYAATRAIREWERAHGAPHTNIIALTASALGEDLVRARESGCDVHIAKPVKKSVLFDAIQKYAAQPVRANGVAVAPVESSN